MSRTWTFGQMWKLQNIYRFLSNFNNTSLTIQLYGVHHENYFILLLLLYYCPRCEHKYFVVTKKKKKHIIDHERIHSERNVNDLFI